MAERPLLLLDSPTDRRRQKGKPQPIPRPITPGQMKQVGRFGERFQRLRDVMSRENPALRMHEDPSGIAPDRALVFEVAGSIDNFANQATQLGFEFLGEIDTEIDPDENFYFEKKKDKAVNATLYLMMPDLRAMQQLLSLWTKYEKGQEFVLGEGKWRLLFEQLNDIRPWGPSDRMTDNFQTYAREWLESDDVQPFRFEVDLWFSDAPDKRLAARYSVLQTLEQFGGNIIHEAAIPPIRYHGLLVQIPRESAEAMLNEGGGVLAGLDSIMFLNPRAMAAFNSAEALGEIEAQVGTSDTPSVAALLDGFPLANHDCLSGRITVEDFLDIEGQCPAAKRSHGTAMASLIMHGDMHAGDVPLENNLLVLPVMVPDTGPVERERIIPDQLAVDVIYTAVRRIKVGEEGVPPINPSVVVINHSLGDQNNPYANKMSAWGRLLDYLSFNFKVLFIVSAGNYSHRVNMSECRGIRDFEDASSKEKAEYAIKAIAEDMSNRQLLPPAESLNPLTVGAWHADYCPSQVLPAGMHNALENQDGPNLISAVGLGHKSAVKPDLYFDGGKVLARLIPNGECYALAPIIQPTPYSGQMVAVPSNTGELNKTTNLCGTSNAAALVTRNAIQLHEILSEIGEENPEAQVPLEYQAVLLKALLTHGCEWNDKGTDLDKIIEPTDGKQWYARRTNISRLLGVGRPDIERVKECTRQRATMLGWGTIEKEHSKEYIIPLPDSLSGQGEFRRMTVTLAWFSPVNPRHQQYRQAVLNVGLQEGDFGTTRLPIQPPKKTIERGTLTHNIFEGSKGVLIGNETSLVISCRQQAGSLDDPVPFGVVVSFEVGADSSIDVYEEVRAKLAVQPRAAVQV